MILLGGGNGVLEDTLNGVPVWRNLGHSHELPEFGRMPELGPEVLGLLGQRLKEGTPVVGLFHAGRHSHVFYNKFKWLENGHLYFAEHFYNGSSSNRRGDKQAYPYDCRDRMAIPWSSVWFLFFAKEADFSFSGSYAGMQYFTAYLRDDTEANQCEAAKTIRGLLEWTAQ